MVDTKRRTPVDDPTILEEWKSIHHSYTDGLGLSKRQSYYRISEKYGCHWTTPKYWIESNIRDASINRLRDKRIPYSKNPRIEDLRTHSRVYQYVRRNPHLYLEKLFSSENAPLTLDEIADRLAETTSIPMRPKTLLKVVSQYEQQHGKKLLTKLENHQPPLYRLKSCSYEKGKQLKNGYQAKSQTECYN